MPTLLHAYQYPRAANTASVVAWAIQPGGAVMDILGILRGKDPFKGMLALPGGFHEPGKETLEETAVRELREETSIDVHTSELKLVCVQSGVDRDPREHVIDHVYSVYVPYQTLQRAKAGDDAAGIQHIQIYPNHLFDKPVWAFDHAASIHEFLSQQQ